MIFMRIVDVWKQDNRILAYCTGENINDQFACKEIAVENKHFFVTGVDVLKSIAGEISVVLGIEENDPQNIPHSDIIVIA